MPEDIKIGLGADISSLIKGVDAARDRVRSFGKAIDAVNPDTDAFRKIQRDLERQGIRTTSAIEAQIVELKGLEKVFGQDAVAAAEIQKRLQSLNAELARVNASASSAVPPFNAFADAQETLGRLGIQSTSAIQAQVQQLESLKQTFQQDAAVVAQLDARIQSLNRNMGSGQGLAANVGRANNALINFSRVVQDAPFGIIGVANNIDPLVTSFQQLQAQTGSSRAAFGALVSALTGPAGIALAIGSVTSLLVVFGDDIVNAFNKGKEAAEEAKKVFEEALGAISFDGGFDDISIDSLDAVKDEIGTSAGLIRKLEKDLENARKRSAGILTRAFVPDQTAQAAAQVLVRQAEQRLSEERATLSVLQNQLAAMQAQQRVSERFSSRRVVDSRDPRTAAADVDAAEILEVSESSLSEFAGRLLEDLQEKVDQQQPIEIDFKPSAEGFLSEGANESIAEATLRLRDFDRAVNAGLVVGLDVAQQRIDLMRERLLTMLQEGVNPADAGFQRLLQTFKEQADAVRNNAIAFTLLEDFAGQALDAILFKAESVADSLRNIGRQILGILARAGIRAGLSAITGNPLSFGNALASVVGVPLSVGDITASTATGVTGGKVPSVQPNFLQGAGSIQVEVVPRFERVSGGDFVIGFNQAESTFKRRGGA